MIRWSPTSRVFSIEPEGMTRACPRVPLTSRKIRPTQNQAMISLLTLALMEPSDSFAAPFLVFGFLASAFTIYLNSQIGPPEGGRYGYQLSRSTVTGSVVFPFEEVSRT